jgi:hypothetical protein
VSNSLEACPNGGPEVFSKVVIFSDDFSRLPRRQKTKQFPTEAIDRAWRLSQSETVLESDSNAKPGWFFNGWFCDVTIRQERLMKVTLARD